MYNIPFFLKKNYVSVILLQFKRKTTKCCSLMTLAMHCTYKTLMAPVTKESSFHYYYNTTDKSQSKEQ